jgi:hypothetical protein
MENSENYYMFNFATNLAQKKSVRKMEWDGMDWIHLAQDSDQWRFLE